MPRLFVILACWLGVAALTGCVSIRNMNPFEPRPLNSAEATYGRFANIPLPKDMTPARRGGFVGQGSSGAGAGMEILQGNVDMAALVRAMPANMARDGWTPRMALSGAGRAVQAYEREDLCAVLYYYRRPAMTIMEVWVGDRPVGEDWRPDAAPSAPVSGESRADGTVQERELP